jgi:hypothetical protein
MGHRHSQALPAKPKNESDPPERHRHNFTVQITLDEVGKVRQVAINHVQSEENKRWSDWEPRDLIDFIVLHAGLQTTNLVHQEIAESPNQVPEIAPTESLPAPTTIHKQVLIPVASDGLAGTLHLRNLEIVSVDANSPAYVLRQGQPYSLRLTMDLTDVIAPNAVALASRATIMAKQPGKPRLVAGEGVNVINLSDRSATINVTGSDLSPGIYHLDAHVTLSPDKADPGHHQPALAASLKGDWLEVN